PVPALLQTVPLPGTTTVVPSSPLFIEARALDDQRGPRPTAVITVRAMPLLTTAIAATDISSATCTGVSVCRVAVSAATLAKAAGTTTAAGSLAFDASAGDSAEPGVPDDKPEMVTVGLRGANITSPLSSTIMADAPLTGTPATGLTVMPRNQTLDVA